MIFQIRPQLTAKAYVARQTVIIAIAAALVGAVAWGGGRSGAAGKSEGGVHLPEWVTEAPSRAATGADPHVAAPAAAPPPTLGANGFDAGAAVDLVASAQRSTQAPDTQTFGFTVPVVPATRTLLLVNGNTDGTRRAASAVVAINGHDVIGPNDLNETVPAIRVPISVQQASNQVMITVRSGPGAEVTVLILP